MMYEFDDLDNHLISLACSLDSHPGKSNWVEDENGLPEYICRIARAILRGGKMDKSRAIATAVSRVKVWASGGGGVDAKTRAKAAAAVAEWEKKKAHAKADNVVKATAVQVEDINISDAALALAATFEDCTPRGLVALTREYKERVTLSELVSRKLRS